MPFFLDNRKKKNCLHLFDMMDETGGHKFSDVIKLHDKIIFTKQDVTYRRKNACMQTACRLVQAIYRVTSPPPPPQVRQT